MVAPVIPAGFYAPLTAEALLSPEHRELRLRQVWDNNPMPRDVYDRMCLEPLSRLLLNTQNVPATREGRWSRAGGFGDLTVLYTTYAVRLARGYMFPPDATPEDPGGSGRSLACGDFLVSAVLPPAPAAP